QEVEFEINPEMQKHQKRQIDILQQGLEAAGWKVTSHKHKGNLKYEVNIEFAHPGTDEILKIVYSLEDASIVSAMLMAPGQQSNILHTMVDNILKHAKASVEGEDEQQKGVTRSEMAEAFVANGWTMSDSFGDVDNSSTYIFTNPKFPDVRVKMRAKNDTKLVFKTMFVFLPGESQGYMTSTTPEDVNIITQTMEDKFAKASVTEEEKLVATLKEIGWEVESSSATALEFHHPEAKAPITVSFLDGGKIQTAYIHWSSGMQTITPTFNGVIGMAKHLLDLAGKTNDPSPHAGQKPWEIDEINNMLKKLGWESKTSTVHDSLLVDFTHGKLSTGVVSVMYSPGSGDIMQAKIIKPGKILQVNPPSPSNIHLAAQELMKSEGI
ncbi:MAG: hypothetical protein KAJ19_27105, partial [Gammaproteobacteria bacterium]|nr:hypothetical protein [Gammaproteobacteria bacterium]